MRAGFHLYPANDGFIPLPAVWGRTLVRPYRRASIRIEQHLSTRVRAKQAAPLQDF